MKHKLFYSLLIFLGFSVFASNASALEMQNFENQFVKNCEIQLQAKEYKDYNYLTNYFKDYFKIISSKEYRNIKDPEFLKKQEKIKYKLSEMFDVIKINKDLFKNLKCDAFSFKIRSIKINQYQININKINETLKQLSLFRSQIIKYNQIINDKKKNIKVRSNTNINNSNKKQVVNNSANQGFYINNSKPQKGLFLKYQDSNKILMATNLNYYVTSSKKEAEVLSKRLNKKEAVIIKDKNKYLLVNGNLIKDKKTFFNYYGISLLNWNLSKSLLADNKNLIVSHIENFENLNFRGLLNPSLKNKYKGEFTITKDGYLIRTLKNQSNDDFIKDVKKFDVEVAKTLNEIKNNNPQIKDKTERTIFNIYEWISENINYNYDVYNKLSSQANGLEGHLGYLTYLQLSGVCDGYSNLMKTMLALEGINSEVVSGFSKNNKKEAHAWLKIGNKFYDPTWEVGSNIVSKKGEIRQDVIYNLTNYYGLNIQTMSIDHCLDGQQCKEESTDKYIKREYKNFNKIHKYLKEVYALGLNTNIANLNYKMGLISNINYNLPSNIKFRQAESKDIKKAYYNIDFKKQGEEILMFQKIGTISSQQNNKEGELIFLKDKNKFILIFKK